MWYRWAIVRVCPRVERGECLNAGIVLFAREQRLVVCRIALDHNALAGLDPAFDPALASRHLHAFAQIAAGDPAGGPIAGLDAAARFDWLTAPRSSVIQTSPVHEGQANDLDASAEQLLRDYVLR